MDQARPDLIVLTGDQLNGQSSSWSAYSAMLKVARLFESRKVPWALVFGNHDDESTDASRGDLMRLAQSLPYFVGSPGPTEIDGVGNYVLKLHSGDASHTHLFTLFFLDSHAYASSLFTTHYDIEWFEREADAIKPTLRPFVPPDLSAEEGVFDISPDLPRNSTADLRRQHAGQTLRKPVAAAIFHIPLPESFDPPDKVDGQSLKFGSQLEGPGGPNHNSGFFDALQRQTELGSVLTLDAESFAANPKPQVRVLVHGHDHITDFCARHRQIWSCFGGGSSYAGYGLPQFDRRVRVLNIQDFGEVREDGEAALIGQTVRTYKIVDSSAAGDLPPDRLQWSDASNVEAEYEAEIEEMFEEEMEAEIIADEMAYEADRYGSDDLGIERRQRRPVIAPAASTSAGRLRTVGGLVLVGRGELGSSSA